MEFLADNLLYFLHAMSLSCDTWLHAGIIAWMTLLTINWQNLYKAVNSKQDNHHLTTSYGISLQGDLSVSIGNPADVISIGTNPNASFVCYQGATSLGIVNLYP